jgi:hypothetical protein
MRARTVLLTVAALLLVASFAGAATPVATDIASALGQPAMSQLQTPACSTSLAAARPVPAGTASRPLTVTQGVCGTCSLELCVFTDINGFCSINGAPGTCQSLAGRMCSDKVTYNCTCTPGGPE